MEVSADLLPGAVRGDGMRWRSILRDGQGALRSFVDRRLGRPLLCSNCLRDDGLRHTSESLGRKLKEPCHLCKSIGGVGLTKVHLDELIFKFFVEGTYQHGLGGYATVLKTSDKGGVSDSVSLMDNTRADWDKIHAAVGRNLFYYGPPLWRLGYTEHWDWYDSGEVAEPHLSRSGLEKAICASPERVLNAGSMLYRVRLNLGERGSIVSEYDAPPVGAKMEFDRFDSADVPIFYAGKTVDVCLHEIRLSNRDEITVATCVVAGKLHLLDITGEGCQTGSTPFEDPLFFYNGLVLSNSRQNECRMLARTIQKMGKYDGFIYKSYHSPVMRSPGVNVAMFGWPIRDGRLTVRSINNIFLRKVRADYQLGPVFTDFAE